MYGPKGPFRRKKIYHGSQFLPGVAIQCGYEKCEDGKEASIFVNRFQGHKASEDGQELRFIQHKFEGMGWKFGRTAADHRCPKCFSSIKAAAARKASENRAAAVNGEKPVSVSPIKSLKDIAPRTLERDDRRIIWEKLNEVYVGDKVGYGDGWTDEKVANDLGVPRGWVKLIRDENFGDEMANEDIKRKVEEAAKKLVEIKDTTARAELIWADLKRLNTEAEHIGKSLDVIRKAVGG